MDKFNAMYRNHCAVAMGGHIIVNRLTKAIDKPCIINYISSIQET